MQHNLLKKANVERICQKLTNFRQIKSTHLWEPALTPSGSITCWQQSGGLSIPHVSYFLLLLHFLSSGSTWELLLHQRYPEAEIEIESVQNLILDVEDYHSTRNRPALGDVIPEDKEGSAIRIRSDLFSPSLNNSHPQDVDEQKCIESLVCMSTGKWDVGCGSTEQMGRRQSKQDLYSNPECLTMYDEFGEQSCVTLYADFGPNTIAEFFQ